MLGQNEKWQEEWITVPGLSSLIPEDHILYKVNNVIKTAWFREEVRDLYDENHGRPSIDPESALRLMLAGFFLGITQDRKLMREAQVNIAIRWFCGYGLLDQLPDHSSLTRIRQRWGVEVFQKVFLNTVNMCAEAGLLSYDTVHVDATLIQAKASMESIARTHVDYVIRGNKIEGDLKADKKPKEKVEKKSTTDPDASLTRTNKRNPFNLCYKQHAVVDDKAGVVVDVDVTTGKVNESTQIIGQIERVFETTGVMPKTVTADTGYATSENYRMLDEMGVDAIIPPRPERRQGKSIPIMRFKYDHMKRIVRCPWKKVMKPAYENRQGWLYKAKVTDCQLCPLKNRCVPASEKRRSVLIVYGYVQLLRARRRNAKMAEYEREKYKRHRWVVEGRNAEAKDQHGLRRACRFGLEQVMIQAFLTSAVINMKRTAVSFFVLDCLYDALYSHMEGIILFIGLLDEFQCPNTQNEK